MRRGFPLRSLSILLNSFGGEHCKSQQDEPATRVILQWPVGGTAPNRPQAIAASVTRKSGR